MAQVEFIPKSSSPSGSTILYSSALFDRIIDVEFLGDTFIKKEKKLETPREVTKQEYEALCKTYTNVTSGSTFVFSPKIVSRKSKDGPFTIATEIEDVKTQRTLCKLECGHGIKPHINLSFRMLPGQLVYHVILKVTNLELPFNVRACTSMHIKAGYRADNLTQSFNMGVFASYVESPGPDDVTVFEGVIVDSLDSFFTTRKVQIDLNNTTTVGELLDTLEQFLPGPRKFNQATLSNKTGVVSTGIKIFREVEPEILKLNVSLGNHSGTFDSGYQALSWAIGLIQDAAKNQKTSDGNPVQIFASVFGTRVIVMDTAHKTAESQFTTTLAVPVINNIKRASFVGPQLTLIAAWFPPLVPGSIFEMEPNFFNGHRLNNNFDVSTWKTETNTYRVITMEVNFDTVTNQNEMIIVALPTDEGGITEEVAAELPVDDIDATVAKAVNQPESEDGTVKVLETNKNGEIEDKTVYDTGSAPPGKVYKAKFAVQIKTVSMDAWRSSDIVITVPYEKELYQKLEAIVGVDIDADSGYTVTNTDLWALIYISTYRKMKEGNKGFFIYTSHVANVSIMDAIQACPTGFKLWIPTLKSGEYKQVLSPFKDMKKDIKKLLDESKVKFLSSGWTTELSILYTLLESL